MVGAQSVLAENWEVVDDGVASRQLLHELSRGTEKSTAEVLRLSSSEEGLGGNLATTARSVDSITNDLHLDENLWVVTRNAIQTGQDSSSFIFAVMVEQPARRFGKRGHHDDDNKGEDTLEGNGESPSEVVRAVETTIVNPVGDERANGNHGAFNTDDLSAVLGLAAPDGWLESRWRRWTKYGTQLTQPGR